MMRAGHVVGRQTKTRYLERNLEERRWEIKWYSSTSALIFQTCSSLFHSGSSKKQTPSNKSKKCFRKKDYGERILYCSSDLKKFNKAIKLFLTLSRHLSCPGSLGNRSAFVPCLPQSSAGSSPREAWPQCRQW